jgi:hypothetical protein
MTQMNLMPFQRNLDYVEASRKGDLPTTDKVRRVLKRMQPYEIRYAVALFYARNTAEACKMVDVPIKWVTEKFNPGITERAEELIDLLKIDYVSHALSMMEYHVPEAVMVKVQGLRADSEPQRQKAATEILDRVYGKASARSDAKQGPTLNVVYVEGMNPANWDGEIIDVEAEDAAPPG